jgi:uncharacterized protein (DUF2252 family)
MGQEDIVTRIQAFHQGRDPSALALKYRAIRDNSFAFLRGTNFLYYSGLPTHPLLDEAPSAWLCGDLHLENFGSFKGDNRLVYFDLNDFDEALLAPCTLDPVRFVTSLLLAGPSVRLDEAGAVALGRSFLIAYAAALAHGKALWAERSTCGGLVRDLLRSTKKRSRVIGLDERTERGKQGRRNLRLRPNKVIPLVAGTDAAVAPFWHAFAARQPDPGFFRLLDIKRRLAGTGSLGVRRYILLVEGRGSPDGNFLFDLKQSLPSSVLSCSGLLQPEWASESERVTSVQKWVQACSPAFLTGLQISGMPFVLRELQPSEDRLSLLDCKGKVIRLKVVMDLMAQVVAWGQLRAAGRRGASSVDELSAFGLEVAAWCDPLLALAQEARIRTEADWQTFSLAYDAGAFGEPPPATPPQ